MTARKPLQWYGDEDGRIGYPICQECSDYMNEPRLIEACASVGIEKGKSTGQLLRETVNAFHARKHEEQA